MCAIPCWGSPADIIRLVRRGESGRLDRLTAYLPDYRTVDLLAPVFADAGGRLVSVHDPAGIPGGSTCTFFERDTGLCSVHCAKPTEGRLACCRREGRDGLALRDEIATTWDTPSGRRLVAWWRARYAGATPCRQPDLCRRAVQHVTAILAERGGNHVVA